MRRAKDEDVGDIGNTICSMLLMMEVRKGVEGAVSVHDGRRSGNSEYDIVVEGGDDVGRRISEVCDAEVSRISETMWGVRRSRCQ